MLTCYEPIRVSNTEGLCQIYGGDPLGRSAVVAHRVRIVEEVVALLVSSTIKLSLHLETPAICESFPTIFFDIRPTLLRSFGNLPVDRYATFPH